MARMDVLAPPTAALLADALLVLHAGVVAFVVLGQVLFMLGGVLAWRWVRRLAMRTAHAVLMVFIAVQAWLGQLCPLTVWEQALRRRAGQAAYSESFIEHWLSRLIFLDAPWWVFVAGYTAFSALVLLTWWWVPPERQKRLA